MPLAKVVVWTKGECEILTLGGFAKLCDGVSLHMGYGHTVYGVYGK